MRSNPHHIPKIKWSSAIKEESKRLGFDFCGIARAEFLKEEANFLERWLKRNFHGRMNYMERNFDKRVDPRKLVEGAKSMISVLHNYFPDEKNHQPKDAPKISKYTWGEDYHFVLKDKLKELLHFIHQKIGEVNARVFVDSAPVMDKVWAKRSGIGWMGKNTNLINPFRGSFFFIGEIICDLELEYDSPIEDFCGTCTRCIDACPTGAIVEPYVLDSNKCISYLTIELKESIPSEFADKMGGWMYGCDICQDVCPWNRFSSSHHEERFFPKAEILNFQKGDWEKLGEKEFKKIFSDSAMMRAKWKGIKRNLELLRTN